MSNMYSQKTYGYNNSDMDLFDFHHGYFGRNDTQNNYAINIVKFHEIINNSIGLKQLCRFCLKRASKKIDKENLESFRMLTNSKLVCKPEYPKSICSLCESQLQSACKLRVSLLDMERCWSEFFRQDYRDFIRSISISEEHIYDEIFLEIEFDSNYSDTSSIRSFEQRPLLGNKNDQKPLSKKSCIGKPRSVQALTMPVMVQRDWNNPKRYSMCHQRSNHTTITKDMETSFTTGNQYTESSHYSHPIGYISEGGKFNELSTERNHDTLSLSNERVDYCLPEENKHDEWNAGSEAHKIEIKCVVVGNAAVGKTSLILSYLKNKFDDQHVPTVSDVYKFDVDVNERLVRVMLYDTAGQDALDPLRRLSYPDCNVFLLCFSVVQPESFHAIKRKWAPTFRHTNASLLLVGTQTDLRSNSETIAELKKQNLRPVASEEAHKLARSIRAKYMETSSRNNDGVKDAFDTAIEIAIKKIKTLPVDNESHTGWQDFLCMCCVG
ncbi:uncharacterized protein LOC119068116 [Bradysia coprophila]|uniref:uncharacterized protein LOC119068116 n=1 Tax=Bradysia coprophila TaxID=38358 RepID=UPI00187DB2A9|nr:uncharacterized protein LOC119068116 [Bradysia coprophila]